MKSNNFFTPSDIYIEIEKCYNKYLKEINEYVITNKSKLDWETIYAIIDLCFNEIVDIIKNYFKISKKTIINWQNYIYKKDNWDLKTKLKEIVQEFNKHINDQLVEAHKNNLIENYYRIIESESYRIDTELSYRIIKEKQSYDFVTITGANGCGGCGGNYGTFLIDSNFIPNLPPYHPYCQCYVYFWTTEEAKEEVKEDIRKNLLEIDVFDD